MDDKNDATSALKAARTAAACAASRIWEPVVNAAIGPGAIELNEVKRVADQAHLAALDAYEATLKRNVPGWIKN